MVPAAALLVLYAVTDMIPFEGAYYLQWGPLPGFLHMVPMLVGLRLSGRVLAGWLTSFLFFQITR